MAASTRWRRLLSVASVCCAFSLAFPAMPARPKAAEATPKAPDDAGALPAASADDDSKPIQIDLSSGPFIKQLGDHDRMPKLAFAPSEAALKPYGTAGLGAPLAFTLANNTPLVRAPAMQKECDAIIATLLAHWQGPKPEVKAYITPTITYGANANEAGLILVNIGTFAGDHPVSNRDELAFLLAHELSHLLLLHRQETGLLPIISKAMSFSGSAFSTYAMVKNSEYRNKTLTMKPDEDMLLRSLGASAASSSLLLDILMPGRDRKREIDADMLGLDLAWRSGFQIKPTDIDAFTLKNTEDEHARSQRMENMRAILLLLITKATGKIAKSATGKLGSVGQWIQPIAMLGSDAAAQKLFDSLANSRKRHIDPAVRKRLLDQYYDANVAGQPYDHATEPPPKKGGKKAARVMVAAAALKEANALIGGAAWASRYEEASFAIYGAGLLADAAKEKENEKNGFFGKMKTKVMGDKKQAETKVSGLVQETPKATNPVVETPAAAMARNRATMMGLIQLLSKPGTVNPAVATSSVAAGRLTTVILQQEPRGQAYWIEGERSGYPIAGLYHDLAASYVRTNNQARLPALADGYQRQIGTVDPVIDVAVGAAVVQGKTVEAEKLAARCLELSPIELYPTCAAYLGYDPAAKGEKAKTPEGAAAFASAGVKAGIKGMFSFGADQH